jgi:hypothetical protein
VDEKILIFDWSWDHFVFKNTLTPWCDGIWLLLGFKRCLWTSYVQNKDLKEIHLNQKWLIFYLTKSSQAVSSKCHLAIPAWLLLRCISSTWRPKLFPPTSI